MIKPPKTPIKPQKPLGVEEYAGGLWWRRQDMIAQISNIAQKRGFEPLETAIIENSAMIKNLFPEDALFEIANQNMVLRYDLTAPLSRYVAQNFQNLPKPFRRFQLGYVFRNDKPEQGRLRQFMQMDADIISSHNPLADAELMMMMADCLEAIGLKPKDYIIKASHRKIIEKVFDECAIDKNTAIRAHIMRSLDKMERLGADGVALLLGEGRKDVSGDFTQGAKLKPKQISRLISFLKMSENQTRLQLCEDIDASFGVNDGTKELRLMDGLFTALGYGEEKICFDSSIVRGLDYYTGCVFEAVYVKDPKFGSIGGGGRYDDILKRFKGGEAPKGQAPSGEAGSNVVGAVGMSIGISRLHSLLQKHGANPALSKQKPIIILAMEDDQHSHYQKLAHNLRQNGLAAEAYLGGGNMAKQLKYANKRSAPIAIIIGEDERAKNLITLKDLAKGKTLTKDSQSREDRLKQQPAQITIKAENLIAECQKILKAHESESGGGGASENESP